MTVWIVWEGGRGWDRPDTLIGIFSSEEKAEAAASLLRKSRSRPNVWVQEEVVK